MCDKKIFELLDNILMNEENPSSELNKLRNTKEFKVSRFEILNKLESIEQDKKFHPEGHVWNHTSMVVDMAAKLKKFSVDTRSLMWAALLHDVGKVTNTKWIRGKWRSYGHDKAGADIASDILKNVSDDEAFKKRVHNLVKYHMHHLYIIKDLPFADMEGLKELECINDIILMFLSDKLGRGEKSQTEIKLIFDEVLLTIEKIEKITGEKYNEINENITDIYLNLKY